MIDIQLIIASWPMLMRGTLVTLQIASLGCFIGFTFGTVLALLQASKNRFLSGLVTLYTTIIRGTPMLIQITFAVYVLPELGLPLPKFWAAVFAIGCNSAAYISQIMRSGINSISAGQLEAAQVLGLSTMQTIWYIILPQAFRVVLPALGNEFITLVKDSSLASIVGVAELYREGSLIISRTYDQLTIYLILACIYLTITTMVSLIIAYLEKRMNHAQD